MPWNGSTYILPPGNSAVTGGLIYAERWNNVIYDIQDALNNVITRDGTTSLTSLGINGLLTAKNISLTDATATSTVAGLWTFSKGVTFIGGATANTLRSGELYVDKTSTYGNKRLAFGAWAGPATPNLAEYVIEQRSSALVLAKPQASGVLPASSSLNSDYLSLEAGQNKFVFGQNTLYFGAGTGYTWGTPSEVGAKLGVIYDPTGVLPDQFKFTGRVQALNGGHPQEGGFTAVGHDTLPYAPFFALENPLTGISSKTEIDPTDTRPNISWNIAGIPNAMKLLQTPGGVLSLEVNGTPVDGGGPTTAAQVSFQQAGAWARPQTADAYMKQAVYWNDATGVDPTGATDSTAGLVAILAYCLPNKIPMKIKGNYVISGTLRSYLEPVLAVGGMHLDVIGDSSITVAPGSAPFDDILCFETTAFNSVTITGAVLKIDGSNKAARGISVRHYDGNGGDVRITAKLKLVNFLNNATTGASSIRENSALQIIGDYGSVCILEPYVDGVNRAATGTQDGKACAGIAIAGPTGPVTVYEPYIANVKAGPDVLQDADGLKFFGKTPATPMLAWKGNFTCFGGTFINNQGRSMKIRSSFARVYGPKIRRTAVATIPSGVDIDFQVAGDNILRDPSFEYYGTAGVAPFAAGNSWSQIAFQPTATDITSVCKSLGGHTISQVPIPRYCAFTPVGIDPGTLLPAATPEAQIYIEDMTFEQITPMPAPNGCWTRAVIEFDANLLLTKSNLPPTAPTRIVVRNVEGPMNKWFIVGHINFISGDLTERLAVEVTGCRSTYTPSSEPVAALGPLSNNHVGKLLSYKVGNNQRVRTVQTGGPSQNFDFNNLVPGSTFAVDLGAATSITNAPPWGTIGTAEVRVSTMGGTNVTRTVCEVVIDDGDRPGQYWYTRDGGVTWTSRGIIATSFANITNIAHNVNTRNKVVGALVIDTTNNRILYASGTSAGSAWVSSVASGTLHYPA